MINFEIQITIIMANKVVSKSFKLDSSTAKLFENLVAESGVTQSDVIRHLIAEAYANKVSGNVANKEGSIAVDFATGSVVKQGKDIGLGTALVISTGAGLAGYYATKQIRKQMGKEEDFGTNYLIGILAGIGALGMLASIFGKRG